MRRPGLAAIRGHQAVVNLLRRLLAAGRLPHAVILDGIPGSGRRTLALALAKAFLCQDRRDGDACNICSACTMVDAGHHPDLTVLPHDTETDNVPVDLIREEVVYKSAQSSLAGNGNVFVVPGVERLRIEAVNALLKVLEEPPDRVLLVLTTDRVDGLLKTVRSRCQTYRLAPLDTADVAEILITNGMAPEQAEARAALAHGSLRHCADDGMAEAPLVDLMAILDHGLRYDRIGKVHDLLEEQACNHRGETPAAQCRGLLADWLDALLYELRRRLTEEPDEVTVRKMERVIARQSEVKLNLQPRVVLESLALET